MAADAQQHLEPGHHTRTDSEAVLDLESAFESFDLDGEGKLDIAAFKASLLSLEVDMTNDRMDEIFQELDTQNAGVIDYADLLVYLKDQKSGHLSERLVTAVKQSSKPRITTRRSTITSPQPPQEARSGVISSKQKQDIQRAVIVIKKAAMKKITHQEVVEFLKDKGMPQEHIDLAFRTAQDRVFSVEERLRHLEDIAQERARELAEEKTVNKHFSSELTETRHEIDLLRDTLTKAIHVLMESYPGVVEQTEVPDVIENEIQERVRMTQKQIHDSRALRQDTGGVNALRIYEADMDKLRLLSECVREQRFFHAFLVLHTLDVVHRNACPNLVQFLTVYSVSPPSS